MFATSRGWSIEWSIPCRAETLIDFRNPAGGGRRAVRRGGARHHPRRAHPGARTGTAAKAFEGFPLSEYPIAGKTGTAEVAKKADFALFAGYGPANDPQYAVAAAIEQAGFGGEQLRRPCAGSSELLGGFALAAPSRR
ncbi:MAG: penicillin-binding transpeptidase domain-containing protein [Acidimicrobiales bacterium]